jgi:CysZ protein
MHSVDDLARLGTFEALREGAFLPLEGARFLRRERRLWPLALVPMVFALLCIGAAGSMFWVRLEWVHDVWTEILPVFEVGAWWSWLWIGPGRLLVWLLAWLAVIVSFALSLVAGLLVANLASAPFLDRLSQHVEAIESGNVSDTSSGGLGTLLADALTSFGAELQRLLFLTAVWGVLSGLGFVIPGAQVVTGPVLIAITLFFLPLDYAGFALDRRGHSFAIRRGWLAENRAMMLGFGGVAFVVCLVPGLNLLILPVQVIAGTLLVVRRPPRC